MNKRQKIAHMHRLHRQIRRQLSRIFTLKDKNEQFKRGLQIAMMVRQYTIIRTMPIQTRAFPKGGAMIIKETGKEIIDQSGIHRIL